MWQYVKKWHHFYNNETKYLVKSLTNYDFMDEPYLYPVKVIKSWNIILIKHYKFIDIIIFWVHQVRRSDEQIKYAATKIEIKCQKVVTAYN